MSETTMWWIYLYLFICFGISLFITGYVLYISWKERDLNKEVKEYLSKYHG